MVGFAISIVFRDVAAVVIATGIVVQYTAVIFAGLNVVRLLVAVKSWMVLRSKASPPPRTQDSTH